jgi:Type II secretion system (T2SS), protein E, N-terminal domain
MPVLRKWPFLGERSEEIAVRALTGDRAPRMDFAPIPEAAATADTFLPQCRNAKCKSGWMKLWRSRQAPILEGKWACSPACMQELVQTAVQREVGEWSAQQSPVHQHRVPLGLLLLSRGWITQEQLRSALEAQKKAGSGRLGEWLIRQKAADEEQITRALSAQWNCPLLSAESFDPAAMAAMFPRLFIDSINALPLRMAGRHLLYVAFEERVDRSLVLAVERMLGLKVEAGVLPGAEFRRRQQEIFRASFPKVRLLEAANARGLVHAFAGMIEETKPVQARIVRVHDYFWLRLWRQAWPTEDRRTLPAALDVEDMVCTLAGNGRS